jgi:hypothetical protein
VSALLQNAGLPPGLFDQPRILVTTEELFALWRGIGHASPKPAIGLELGTEIKPEHFDPIALAALSTGSFGEAMRQMARYNNSPAQKSLSTKPTTQSGAFSFDGFWPTMSNPKF